MKILIVCNNVYVEGNGLRTAVLSLLGTLKQKGVDARLLSCENDDPSGPQPDFPLKHFKVPVFEPLIEKNGFRFAHADTNMLHQAVEWADVIHLEEAFPLEIKALERARELKKPCVGSFHLYAQNVIANIPGVRHSSLLASALENYWRDRVFNLCEVIHCPAEKVKENLVEQKFSPRLEVFSNGIRTELQPKGSRVEIGTDGPVDILCIGRLSEEKDQTTLLNAMRISRHSRRIRLHFAGKGPYLGKYRRMAEKLLNEGVLSYTPEFGFYSKSEISALAKRCFLLVHCATVEVEGLSCIEAIREGIVPLIAESRLSSAGQFALDDRSLFKAGDSAALALKIDYWIEHAEERNRMSGKYAASSLDYSLDKTTEEFIKLYGSVL